MKQKHIVIIGAGFGGLSAAAYAAKAGYKVTVLEKNAMPGGRAMVKRTKGFTFDLGPSWYMMPDIFDDFFKDFGKNTSDYYKLVQLDPSYKVFTETSSYDMRAVNKKGLDIFESIELGSSAQLKKLLKKTKNEYELVRANLLEHTYQNSGELFNKATIKMAANPRLLRSYHLRIAHYVKNNDIQKILEFMVVFMGGSPHNIPALYSLLTHVDLGLGIWYPMGGFGSVVSAFEKLGSELGVTYI